MAKASYHHGDLRRALVEAATELVRTSGSDDFSLRDAAKAVGVTANATYRHFDSKADLLAAVALAAADDLAAKMKRKLAALERDRGPRDGARAAVEELRIYGRAYVAYALEQPALFRLMHGPAGLCNAGAVPTAERTTEVARLFGRMLDRLVEVGVLAQKRRLEGEIPLWMAMHGFAALALDGLYQRSAQRTAALETLLDFALRGLGIESR